MELRVPEYIKALNTAKGQSLLDWFSPSQNRYEFTVEKLTVVVELDSATSKWQWALRHSHRGTLTMGDSESKDLAQQEALAYAEHWVRNAMVGVLA